jgi:hypothetical protein
MLLNFRILTFMFGNTQFLQHRPLRLRGSGFGMSVTLEKQLYGARSTLLAGDYWGTSAGGAVLLDKLKTVHRGFDSRVGFLKNPAKLVSLLSNPSIGSYSQVSAFSSAY